MRLYWLIPLILLGVVLLGTLITSYVCFFRIFRAKKRKKKRKVTIPEGATYDPYRARIKQWISDADALPYRAVSIRSHDGLTLVGRYYEYKPGAPIELMLHGYKSNSRRDLSGGIFRCFSLGRNALLVDHRASGGSEGRVITFGAKEVRDCLDWVDFVIREIDPHARIILTGISMGAATVMMASGRDLPQNVVGVLADCGYTSTREIVQKVMTDMGLPARLLYPFARLGAILYGRFDPDKDSPLRAMERCHLPILFIHGDADDFVPASMSERNYQACASAHKRLVLTPNAAHGLCFPADEEGYIQTLREFFEPFL